MTKAISAAPVAKLQRIQEQRPGFFRAVSLAVVVEREAGRLRGALRREEALPQQEAERHDREVERQCDADAR